MDKQPQSALTKADIDALKAAIGKVKRPASTPRNPRQGTSAPAHYTR